MNRLTLVSTITGISVSVVVLFTAAAAWNPLVLKSELRPVIQLIGGDLINNNYLRIGQLEGELYGVQRDRDDQLRRTNKVEPRTRERIIQIDRQIKVLEDKIRKQKKEFNQ